ncbi:MAG: ethylbenzene dehydrogenase-related protein [Thermodesulfobacteriota bacterium]
MKRFVLLLSVFFMVALMLPLAASAGEPDWNKIDEEYIDLFYPGQSAWEWLSSEHKGKKSIARGDDKCIECHQGEEEDRGKNFVTGKKLEENPPPAGTPGMITALFKGAYDSEYMYLWFQWEGPGKADKGKINALNFMIDDMVQKKKGPRSRVKYFEAYGCWITCHKDATNMPYEPDAAKVGANALYKDSKQVTKYLPGTRTAIDATGGWDKLKPDAKLQKRLGKGKFIDLWRFVADSKNPKGKVVDESVFTARTVDKSQDDLSGKGEYKDGKWTVVLKRKLKSGDPKEDKLIEPGKTYAVAVSIHVNSSNRRHYASFSRILGFDDADADLLVGKAK